MTSSRVTRWGPEMPDNVLARRFVLLLHAIFFCVHRDPVNTHTYGKRTPALPAWIVETTGVTFLDLTVKWVMGFYNGFHTSEVTRDSGVMWDACNGRLLTFQDKIFAEPKAMYLTLRRLAGGKHGARETYLSKAKVFPHIFFGQESLYALVEVDGYLSVDTALSTDIDFKLAVLSPELLFPAFPMELREQHRNLSQARVPADNVIECGSKVSKHACEDPMDTRTQRTDDSASQRPSKKRRVSTKVNVVNIHTRLQLMKHERWQQSLARKQEREMKRALMNNSFSKKGSTSKKGGSRSA